MFATGINFTPDADTTVDFRPARVSKTDALQIGYAYYTAAAEGREQEMDAMIEEVGSLLARRSLMAFANTVRKHGHTAVADAALSLRSDIRPAAKSAA